MFLLLYLTLRNLKCKLKGDKPMLIQKLFMVTIDLFDGISVHLELFNVDIWLICKSLIVIITRCFKFHYIF